MSSRIRATIALSLLAVGLLARPAAGQPESLRVQTRDGLSFTLPHGYRPAPELRQPAGTFETAFTEEAPEANASPVQLFVVRAPELATQEVFGLDDYDASTQQHPPTGTFVDTVRNTLGLQTADVTSSGFDADRGALWLTFRHRSGSQAQSLIELGPDDPAWRDVEGGSVSATALACVLRAVLGEAPAVEASVLPARAQSAAVQCRQPAEVVRAYLNELGPAFFAPFEMSFAIAGYPTRTALVLTVVASDGSRAHDVEALARQLRSTASVAREALPDGTGPDRQEVARAKSLGSIGGAIAGSALGVLVFGVLLGFALRWLGVSASRAAGGALAAVSGVGLVSWLLSGALTPIAFAQLVTYVVAGALAYRPLKRWLEGRPGPRGGNSLLTDVRGLTTIEYSVLFVMVVVACVVVWKQLGQSLVTTVSRGTEKYSAELESAALSSGASSNAASTWPGRGGVVSPSGAGSPTQSSAPAEPPSLWQRVSSATFEHPAVQQFTRDHPIATALGKEAAVMAAETFVPGVAAYNAVRTLRDDKASRFEKGVAVATLATAAVPPIAAAVRGVSKLVKGVRAARELRRAAQASEKTLELAAEGADTVKRVVGAEMGVLRRTAKAEKAAKEAGEAALRPSAATRGASSVGAMARAKYVASPKHGSAAYNTARGVASRAPTNGQAALDTALELGNGTRRVGVDRAANEFVVFDQTNNIAARFPEFHGHVRNWSELTPQMQSLLIREGYASRAGKILVP